MIRIFTPGIQLSVVVGCVLVTLPSYALQLEFVSQLQSASSRSDGFGFDVAIDGDLGAVGAFGDRSSGLFSGATYVFDLTTGQRLNKLVAADSAPDSYFGWSIDFDGNLILVGAHRDDVNGRNSGSAYLFDATSGQQMAKLAPTDGQADDWFGVSVALDGNLAVIGASLDDDKGSASGSTYIFNARTGDEILKLTLDVGSRDDQFGRPVASEGKLVLVGAFGRDAAFVYKVPEPASGLSAAAILCCFIWRKLIDRAGRMSRSEATAHRYR